MVWNSAPSMHALKGKLETASNRSMVQAEILYGTLVASQGFSLIRLTAGGSLNSPSTVIASVFYVPTNISQIYMNRLILLLTAIISVFGVSLLVANPEDEAKKSAQEWLSLVDAGKFKESWKAAGTYLQRATNEDTWERNLELKRKPLGKLVSRELKSAKSGKPLNKVPDGDYVTLRFTSSFENKKEAIETVTPVLQKDGTWKVSGYYIE